MAYFQPEPPKRSIKVAMLGDVCIGKTTLKVAYKTNKFDEDYAETFGVDVLEKDVNFANAVITISMFDLGGSKEFATLLPAVVDGAHAILFMFDLTRQSSLFNVKRWFVDAKKETKQYFIPFLVGTKYDLFKNMSDSHKQEVDEITKKYSKKMRNATIIYCSSQDHYNVNKIFDSVIEQVLDIKKKKAKNKDENKKDKKDKKDKKNKKDKKKDRKDKKEKKSKKDKKDKKRKSKHKNKDNSKPDLNDQSNDKATETNNEESDSKEDFDEFEDDANIENKSIQS